MLTATIDFQFEVQTVAFIEGRHACTLYGADVDECVRLTVVALDEAKALHCIEELDRAAGALTRQLALRATAIAAAEAATVTTEAACAGFTGFTRTIDDRKGLTLDLEVGRRNLAAAIHQGEAERLTFGKAGQASLLHSADVNEHVFRAIITNDEAEAFLSVEEFDYAGAFADDLGRHTATAATTAAEAATTAAAKTAAAAAETAATAAEAVTAATAEAIAAAKAAAITAEAATITAAVEIVVAEPVALILAAPAAATSIKTHALLVTFASPKTKSDKHAGRNDMQNPPQGCGFRESLYQFFRAARMILARLLPH
ncbi:hypothetical protein FHS54_000546 [Sphingobium vermicomposti]|uniref:Uncharacterized protein n=1 Tax=Sphingobium vermicomposti TaxID=529005 RepID=A0A846M0C0_9SPHN|nr:hypothetical protein [Sphingobium vermicomposti]